jgi:glycine oxidase ThiO
MSKSTCDVAVIGGGVIGLACAWRLAPSGARVQLFERGEIGREASHAAAGMLAAQCEAAVHPPVTRAEYCDRSPFFDLCLQSRALYPSFASELLEASGVDVELSLLNAPTSDWREPGILFVGEENDRAFAEFEKQRASGLRAEAAQNFHSRRALWLPDEGQVENRKLVAALKLACERAGVSLHEYSDVSFEELKGQSETVLLCGGAWSTLIARTSLPALEVRPVAGEVLSLRPEQAFERVVYSRDVYLVPRRDGRVLVGATMIERGFQKTLTAPARDELLNAARELVPEVASWKLEDHWSGLRPATPDGLPILGRTSVENVFVATGHFRNGILLTPITAQLMADCILENKVPPREFSIERFAAGVLAS